jgi:pteridine reductase
MTTLPLQDKIVLVTGAGQRLGQAIALHLAQAGAHVAVHYHQSVAGAAETCAKIRALGRQALPLAADLSQPPAIDAMFAELTTTYGELHVLVNSAAVFVAQPLLALDYATWQHSLAVNLTAPLLCCQAAARLMSPGGCIINISDIGGSRAWVKHPAQSITKAALNMLTQTAARSLAPHIRVNGVAPGLILPADTESSATWQALQAKVPLGKTGQPLDVAAAVLFLVTQPYLTGITLPVSGGWELV